MLQNHPLESNEPDQIQRARSPLESRTHPRAPSSAPPPGSHQHRYAQSTVDARTPPVHRASPNPNRRCPPAPRRSPSIRRRPVSVAPPPSCLHHAAAGFPRRSVSLTNSPPRPPPSGFTFPPQPGQRTSLQDSLGGRPRNWGTGQPSSRSPSLCRPRCPVRRDLGQGGSRSTPPLLCSLPHHWYYSIVFASVFLFSF